MVGSAEQRGGFATMITELAPPLGSFRPLALAFFLGLATLSLAALALNWRRVREADLLAWVAFFHLAMSAGRNVALFAVVATPILVRNWNEVLDRRPLPARAQRLAAGLVAGLALLVAGDAALGRFYARIGPYRIPGFGVNPGFFPSGAADWILRTRPPAPIAHWLGEGGYLIWALWPEYRVMNDGRRLEVFGLDAPPALLTDDPEAFAKLDAEFRFGTVLLNHRRAGYRALLPRLHASSEWRLAFLDDVSVVFVRAGAAPQAALDLDDPALLPSLDGVPDLVAREAFATRARLLLLLGRADLAARWWEHGLRRFPDQPRGEEMLAALRARAAGDGAQPAPPHAR
jgi:hypothetical protein